MNNFEKIKECETLSELALFLSATDLALILETEQPIPDPDFYEEWLLQEV
jgi:vacuolar-type H+-ATPase subunit C/Vma6